MLDAAPRQAEDAMELARTPGSSVTLSSLAHHLAAAAEMVEAHKLSEARPRSRARVIPPPALRRLARGGRRWRTSWR